MCTELETGEKTDIELIYWSLTQDSRINMASVMFTLNGGEHKGAGESSKNALEAFLSALSNAVGHKGNIYWREDELNGITVFVGDKSTHFQKASNLLDNKILPVLASTVLVLMTSD